MLAGIFWSIETVPGWLRYFLLAVVAWLVVDFTTTAVIRNPLGYYSKYMPALLIFYLGYPLTFCTLIYKFRLGPKGVLVAMIAGLVLVEIVFTHNMLLLTLPICLLAVPIGLGYYGMVTFLPLWASERTLGKNRRWAVVMVVVWGFGVVLNILTQFGRH